MVPDFSRQGLSGSCPFSRPQALPASVPGVPMGLAAAMTVQRACSEVTMPAFEMEILCCSMAS